MNRKQRRIAQSQEKQQPAILFRGKSYTLEEAAALAKHNVKNAPAVAVEMYSLIIAKVPNHAGFYTNQGVALQDMGRFDEALSCYSKAIALDPNLVEAYNNRGHILYQMERYTEALPDYDKAIALNSVYALAYNGRGTVLQKLNRLNEALADYDKAAMLAPDYADAYSNLGNVFYMLRRHDEALVNYEKAVTLKPDIPYLLGMFLYTQMQLCRWQRMDILCDVIGKAIDAGGPAAAPFTIIAASFSLLRQKRCAELFAKNNYPERARLWNGEVYSHDRIRIGYFSADFTNHATAHLMAQFFELHDRSRFEVTAFSFGASSASAMRNRLENAFEHFIDVSGKSDLEIAALARNLEIDIAIDLKGFTRGCRTGIFALRPAPVQTAYMGFPSTMGAPYIDYLVADALVIPDEHKRYYSEKIVHLPNSYWVIDSTLHIPEKTLTREELGLPKEGFVFCCFNDNYKITPDVFDSWMRLLHKVPGSVLWLLKGNQGVVANLRAEAELRGIAGYRLVFAERMGVADHLARHRLADLFLDTFHCNAHTTASDALWVGLPVVTCLGETFAARVAASILKAVGLAELITHSHAEYEALALELALNPYKLSAMRQTLKQNRNTCPLFNTPLFTRNMEEAYINMWERSQAGLPPDDIACREPVACVN